MANIDRIGPAGVAALYGELALKHKAHLAEYGVKLPQLMNGQFYSQKALTLICLYQNMGQPVTKAEITKFCLENGAKPSPDIQPRHLATQDGWNILLKRNREIGTESWPQSSYGLINVNAPKLGFRSSRREGVLDDQSWSDVCTTFKHRCATCGSPEGEANYRDLNSITKLEKGHCDPSLPLTLENCIPQCQKCNRDLGNEWVWDVNGKPRAIHDPRLISRSSKEVKREVLRILLDEFDVEPDMN